MKCYDGINLLAEGHCWWLLHTSFSGVKHDLFISEYFPSLETVFYWMLYGPARASCHHKADAPIGVGFHIITRWCNLGWDAAVYIVAKGFFLFLLLLPPLPPVSAIPVSPLRVLWLFPNTRNGTLLPNGIKSRTAISFLVFRQSPTLVCSFLSCAFPLRKGIALLLCQSSKQRSKVRFFELELLYQIMKQCKLALQACMLWPLFLHPSWYLEPVQSAVFIVPVINATIQHGDE